MKFAMYVIDFEECEVFGTNDVEDIQALIEADSTGERYVIIHSTYGDYQLGDNPVHSITQLESSDSDDPDPDEEDDPEGEKF
jgi:hypothetical protein